MEIFQKVGTIKKITNGYKASRVISAAEELGVFNILDKTPLSNEEIARKANIESKKMEAILNALTCIGIVEKSKDGFYLGEYYDVLCSDSPQTQCGYIRHATTMMNKWSNLTQAAKVSQIKQENFQAITGEEKKATVAFIQAMNANALPQAKFIVEQFNFENHKILDVGAGAGTYCIAVGEKYESATGVLMDLPAVCEIIDANLLEHKLNNRFETYPKNYNEGIAEGKYDDVFMFAVAHQENDKNLQELLKRVYNSLVPGGRLFLSSFFLNEDRISPEFSVMFAIEMLVMSTDGKVYTHSEINKYIENAGFKNINKVDGTKGPATIYTAIKE